MYCNSISMRKPRIIIFDDDAMVLEILKDIFSMFNFEVQSFREPVLCHLSNKCSYPCADIIITDFQMPRINGIDLLKHQIQQGCPIHIKNKAIMSGDLPDKYAGSVKEFADTFFQKPIAMLKLNTWAKRCISRNDLSQPLGNYYV